MGDSGTSTLKDAVSDAKGRWARLKQRRRWVRHLTEAWGLLDRNRGNQFAAAITYFSFLALFPLILLGVSVLGFVLHSHPAALQTLLDNITDKVPGTFGNTLKTSIKSAISARTGVGLIGLAGVLLTGLGWIANLRSAIDAVWGKPPVKQNFFVGRARNLFVLVGLGVGIVVSLGLTVAGTALTDQLLRAVGLEHQPGVHVLLRVLGLVLAVLGDVLIFWWLLVRLPAVGVPRGIAWRGALFAAVGFEVLKVVGTYTIALSSKSPTAGPFASILAVLIWIQLVARVMLFCCAWTAVLTAEATPAAAAEAPVPMPVAAEPVEQTTRDAKLVGAGAAAGAFTAWLLTRSRAIARQGETSHNSR